MGTSASPPTFTLGSLGLWLWSATCGLPAWDSRSRDECRMRPVIIFQRHTTCLHLMMSSLQDPANSMASGAGTLSSLAGLCFAGSSLVSFSAVFKFLTFEQGAHIFTLCWETAFVSCSVPSQNVRSRRQPRGWGVPRTVTRKGVGSQSSSWMGKDDSPGVTSGASAE